MEDDDVIIIDDDDAIDIDDEEYIDFEVVQETQAALQAPDLTDLANEAEDYIRAKLSKDPVLKANYKKNYHRSMAEWSAAEADKNRTALKDMSPQEIREFLAAHVMSLCTILAITVMFAPSHDQLSQVPSPLTMLAVASAVERMWSVAADYQEDLLARLSEEGKSDAELDQARILQRYGGVDLDNATHTSITFTELKGRDFWKFFTKKGEGWEWAAGVVGALIDSIRRACEHLVNGAEVAKVTFMYYGTNSKAAVQNRGEMKLHADSGIDRYKYRACARLESGGGPTTMRWAWAGFENQYYWYDMQIDSGSLIFGGNDLWRYKATRVKHGVPPVSTPRHTVIIDWK